MKARILIVDDEEIVLRSCTRILDSDRYHVESVLDPWEALRRIDENGYDVLVLDIMMPKIDGLEVLQHVKERHPDVDVIMMTGLSQIQTAVKAMKLGAFDYLSKPFDPDELKLVVDRALERQRLLQENRTLKSEASSKYRFENIVGGSPQMQNVYRLIAKCAPTNCTVLITGESGTGKEMIARAIHYNSLRKDQPFVAVDCNTLSENLLESELFGHVKGAFTGAVSNKRGMFDMANNGTLFLDELGNIPLSTQAKLLRVIQEREFKPVGDTRSHTTNVRLLAATNRDPKAMVGRGHVPRGPLLPPQRLPDPHTAAAGAPRRHPRAGLPVPQGCSARSCGKPAPKFSEGAMSLLMNHDWPGNVRELQNAVHRAVILASDDTIRQAHLASILDAAPRSDLEVPGPATT